MLVDAKAPARTHGSDLLSASRGPSWQRAVQQPDRQPVNSSRPPQLRSLPLQEQVSIVSDIGRYARVIFWY